MWRTKLASIFALCIIASAAFSEENNESAGRFLKNGVIACDRIYVTQNATDKDINDCTTLTYFVYGVLAVHQRNNLYASMLIYSLDTSKKGKPNSPAVENQLKIALMFAPLLGVPEKIDPQQSVLIIKNYLNSHPEKWNGTAESIITDAFEQAFSKK